MALNRFALWIEYDGAPYQGFQRLTPRHVELKRGRGSPRSWRIQQTVQEELEIKLSTLCSESVKVWSSGRTDQGVHATCQVVSFECSKALDPGKLQSTLGAILDPSVRVFRVEAVGEDFHPRFSARQRTYHYYILAPVSSRTSPFWSRCCWLLEDALDVEAMQRAALGLLGRHDFTSYGRKLQGDQESKVRELLALRFLPDFVATPRVHGPFAQLSNLLCVEVCANAFLRRMVRQLVANLVEVGKGRWPEERPAQILHSRDSSLGAPPAPAEGLFLVDIAFAPRFELG